MQHTRRWRKQLFGNIPVFAALIILGLLCPGISYSQPAPVSKPVTLKIDQVPFLAALRLLFRQVGVTYILEDRAKSVISDNLKVTLNLQSMSFSVALDRLMRYTDGLDRPIGILTYRQEAGKYVFSPGEGLKDEKITLKLINVDLKTALKRACAQVEASYVFNLDGCPAQNVTLSVEQMPFAEVIRRILEAAHVGPTWEFKAIHGVAMIGRRMNPFPQESAHSNHPLQDKIEVHLEPKENLYITLCAVCYSLAINFVLDPELRKFYADSMTQTLPAQKMMLMLMRISTTPLKFEYENQIVAIIDPDPAHSHSDGH